VRSDIRRRWSRDGGVGSVIKTREVTEQVLQFAGAVGATVTTAISSSLSAAAATTTTTTKMTTTTNRGPDYPMCTGGPITLEAPAPGKRDNCN